MNILFVKVFIDLFEINVVVYNLLSKRKDYDVFVTIFNEFDILISDYQTIKTTFMTFSEINYSPDKRLINDCLTRFF
jgi:hypothetical protein